MKTRYRLIFKRILAVNLALCLFAIHAFPKDRMNVVPRGNWALAELLKQDTAVSVRMTSGDRMDGKFLTMDSEAIHITIDKRERIYPRGSIAEIWQLRVPDRKLNGIIYGLLAGAAAGAIVAGAGGLLEPTGDSTGKIMGPGFIMAGMGLGAAIGGTTDALIRGNKLLYRK
jgi:hypothetical protein